MSDSDMDCHVMLFALSSAVQYSAGMAKVDKHVWGVHVVTIGANSR